MEILTAGQREKRIYAVTLRGSAVNLLLVIYKLAAGILGHSAAMVADAVHSLTDLAGDAIVIVFVRLSGKPCDRSHAYGYGKFETLATFLIGCILGAVGLGIAWNGIGEIMVTVRGGALESPGWVAFAAALVSMLSKEALSRYTVRQGRRLNSDAVVANGWHHRSDALSSAAATLGIGGAILLGPRWAILDPIAALVVSGFILHAAAGLVKPCLDELLERSLDGDIQDTILGIVHAGECQGALCDLRTRKIGSYYAIELRMRLDGDLPLREIHKRTSALECRLREHYGQGTLIAILTEPAET